MRSPITHWLRVRAGHPAGSVLASKEPAVWLHDFMPTLTQIFHYCMFGLVQISPFVNDSRIDIFGHKAFPSFWTVHVFDHLWNISTQSGVLSNLAASPPPSTFIAGKMHTAQFPRIPFQYGSYLVFYKWETPLTMEGKWEEAIITWGTLEIGGWVYWYQIPFSSVCTGVRML